MDEIAPSDVGVTWSIRALREGEPAVEHLRLHRRRTESLCVGPLTPLTESDSMAHSWRIRSRTRLSARVHFQPLDCTNRSSLFAAVRIGRICKQGVVGSSPIVSTRWDLLEPVGTRKAAASWRLRSRQGW